MAEKTKQLSQKGFNSGKGVVVTFTIFRNRFSVRFPNCLSPAVRLIYGLGVGGLDDEESGCLEVRRRLRGLCLILLGWDSSSTVNRSPDSRVRTLKIRMVRENTTKGGICFVICLLSIEILCLYVCMLLSPKLFFL